MDTKLRKSSRLAKVFIALSVLLPALVLVSLYPTVERAMNKQEAYYEENLRQEKEKIGDWILVDNFVNYATESAYCLYVRMLNEANGTQLDDRVYKAYGWYNDLEYLAEQTTYQATYQPNEHIDPVIMKNASDVNGSLGKLILAFDAQGNLIEHKLMLEEKVCFNRDVASAVHDSENQLESNLSFYEEVGNLALESYMPKNFRIEIGINEESDFVNSFEEWYGVSNYDPENLFVDVGGYWIVVLLCLFVAFVAMTLPIIKKLNTGNEKIFSMSFETMIVTGVATVFGVLIMAYLMAYTTINQMEQYLAKGNLLLFMGHEPTAKELYMLARIGSFILWTILFFAVYCIASNVRQMICNTNYYFKYQTVSIRFFRWLKNKTIKFYKKLMTFDLKDRMDKAILIIVGVQVIILLMFATFIWMIRWNGFELGLVAIILFAAMFFVILRHYMKKVQEKYKVILHATEKMAEGDFAISLDEELGIFQTLGNSLGKVQQGFEKAVKDEAKSQSMKTELITNVSHDLKTPLTAIITYVDLLKKDDIPEEEKQSYIKTLEQKSQRLKVLIEDLFEVSKAQSGNVTMNFMDVDVVSLMKQVKSEMADQLAESSLDFRFDLPEEKIILSLDGQRTYRVFENLIQNTIKYSMPFSRVYIDIQKDGTKTKIIFRNVSAQELHFDPERLSERFVRGDASRNSDGSGLGLAIAKSFVELQKGTFKIDIDGDLFKVTLSWD